MNRALWNPFIAHALPEEIQHVLDYGQAIVCVFNRTGSLLATGYRRRMDATVCDGNDGRIILWDMHTMGVARELIAHVHPVTSLSFSRDGRRLASSSTDWSVKMWDLATDRVLFSLKLDSPVLSAHIHPYRMGLVASSLSHPAIYIEQAEDGTLNRRMLPLSTDASITTEEVMSGATKMGTALVPACFNKKGARLFTGTPKGLLIMFDTSSWQILHSVTVSSTPVKTLTMTRDCKFVLCNSTDKHLRLYNADDLSLLRTFVDTVNRFAWKTVCFSGNGEYLVAASAHKSMHKVYVWNTEGQLEKIMEQHKEGILSLSWHPRRPLLASCSNRGHVQMYGALLQESWTAYAPKFTEVEENIEYIEREDEFDHVDEAEELARKRQKIADEDVEVDIVNVHVDDGDEESSEDLFVLPVVPEQDIPEGGVHIPSSSQEPIEEQNETIVHPWP